MNWEHTKAIVWLRSRLLANALNRKGKRGTTFAAILVSIVLIFAVGLFVLAFFIGKIYFVDLENIKLMFLWDALVVGYAGLTFIGVAVSVQQSAPLSIDKFLHLPVSPVGAFMSNFVSSFVSLNNILILPILLGFSIGLIVAQGASQIMSIPLSFALVFMVTALVYQLEAWLAKLMANKRMKVIVMIVFMLPVMIGPVGFNIFLAQEKRVSKELNGERWTQVRELDAERDSDGMDPDLYKTTRAAIMEKYDELGRTSDEEFNHLWFHRIEAANVFVPIGWVPFGIQAAEKGKQWPGWVGMAGMLLIGGLSLTRSYRHTIDMSKGRQSRFAKRVANKSSDRKIEATGRRSLVDWKVPFASEQVSAIAMANLRVIMRAPETKMQLLVPLIFLGVFGSIAYMEGGKIPEIGELLAAAAVLGMMCIGAFGMLIMIENQFGLDGNGFRGYLLLPAKRHEILIGKNLAASPAGLGYGFVVLGFVQFFIKFELAMLLATCIQFITICTLLCLVGNMVSIYLSQDPSAPKLAQGKREILQMLVSVIAVPFAFLPVYIPFVFAMIFRGLGGVGYLVASLVVCGVTLFAYSKVVVKQGKLLQKREIGILETVAPKVVA